MARNWVIKNLTGAGSFTVPPGVTQIRVSASWRSRTWGGAGQASVVRTSTGRLLTFGSNAQGLLGDATTVAARSSPTLVVGGRSFIEVNSNQLHMIAIQASDATLWAWGINGFNELADGSTIPKSSPVAVIGVAGRSFIQCNSANNFSTALEATGQVWAWGRNNNGQLGNNTVTNSATPVQVVGTQSFVEVSSRNTHSLARRADGTVWAWGLNDLCQLGDGTFLSRSSPVLVSGGHSFIRISAGAAFSLALKANGECWSWGNNGLSQLGDGTNAAIRSTPVLVAGGHSFVAISAGENHGYGLLADGSIRAWGAAGTAIGDGSLSGVNRSTPVLVVGGRSFVDVVAGGEYALALQSDGAVWSWGLNLFGTLGDNTGIDRNSPVQVVGPQRVSVQNNEILLGVIRVRPSQVIAFDTLPAIKTFGQLETNQIINTFTLVYKA